MKLGMSLLAAGALVVGTTAMSASATIHNEDAAIGELVGALETNGAVGFGAAYDRFGRTVAGAEPVADTTTEIRPLLWLNTDADLFQVNVTDAANFQATIQGGHSLAVFDAAGNGLAALIGPGTIDDSWISGNGTYYIGIGADGSNPRNAAGQDIFNLAVGVASGPVAGDAALSADPAVAWEFNNLPTGLFGPGNFTEGTSAHIFLSIPEPASLSLLALGGLTMLRRRA